MYYYNYQDEEWEEILRQFVSETNQKTNRDISHDETHNERVVKTCKIIVESIDDNIILQKTFSIVDKVSNSQSNIY